MIIQKIRVEVGLKNSVSQMNNPTANVNSAGVERENNSNSRVQQEKSECHVVKRSFVAETVTAASNKGQSFNYCNCA